MCVCVVGSGSLTKTYSDPVGGAPMTEGLKELRDLAHFARLISV